MPPPFIHLPHPRPVGSTPSTGAAPPPQPAGDLFGPSAFQTAPAKDLGVTPQGQGNSNACGTTALAELLTYWGKPTTHSQIDSSIRTANIGTPADSIVSYAQAHGMRASSKNEASLSDVTHLVDQGVPVMVEVDPPGNPNGDWHYVNVVGYSRDASGQVTSVDVVDSGGTGFKQTLTAQQFQQEWGKLSDHGLNNGISNFMIAMVPQGNQPIAGSDGITRPASHIALPQSSAQAARDAAPELTMEDGGSNVVNGWTQHNPGKVAGGLVEAAGGAAGLLTRQIPGLRGLGNGIADASRRLGNDIQDPTRLLNPVNVVSDVVSTVTDAVSSVFDSIASIFGF